MVMQHHGMFLLVSSLAGGTLPPPDHFVFISAGTFDSTKVNSVGLTEFTDYTVNGGGSRPTGILTEITNINADGDLTLRIGTGSQDIEVTAAGTIIAVFYTSGSVKNPGVWPLHFSVPFNRTVEIGDKLSINHRHVIRLGSDITPG